MGPTCGIPALAIVDVRGALAGGTRKVPCIHDNKMSVSQSLPETEGYSVVAITADGATSGDIHIAKRFGEFEFAVGALSSEPRSDLIQVGALEIEVSSCVPQLTDDLVF